MKTSIPKKEQNTTLNASKKQTRPPMNTVGLESDDRASIREILSKQILQPKLKIGVPNDKYEQEADRVAEMVLRMPKPQIGCQPLEEVEKEKPIQAKPVSNSTLPVSPQVELEISKSRGNGQKLDSKTKARMETSMGRNFSDVRIHTDMNSDILNKVLGSRAFTTARDIFFRQGEYRPGSSKGDELIAHELTHVVQQNESFKFSDIIQKWDPGPPPIYDYGYIEEEKLTKPSGPRTEPSAAVTSKKEFDEKSFLKYFGISKRIEGTDKALIFGANGKIFSGEEEYTARHKADSRQLEIDIGLNTTGVIQIHIYIYFYPGGFRYNYSYATWDFTVHQSGRVIFSKPELIPVFKLSSSGIPWSQDVNFLLTNEQNYVQIRPLVNTRGHNVISERFRFEIKPYMLMPGTIQPKLKMSSPNDKYELEADLMAEEVVGTSNHINLQQVPRLTGSLVQRHTASLSVTQSTGTPDGVKAVIGSVSGQPLDRSSREFMESRFGGHDFSTVRIHRDAKAERAAEELHARAFTVGHNIMFGSGQYSPESMAGKKLLAHELTHVVQQDTQHHIGNPRVMCKSYGNEEFSFDMQEDGRIIVKKGDWLSKYSAAMYDGDTSHTYEFVRIKNNSIIPIENVDLIIEGESIYHIFTLFEYTSREKPAATETPNGKPAVELPKPAPPSLYEIPEELKSIPPGHVDPNLPSPQKPPSILRGKPQIEFPGEIYKKEEKEKKERRGGSPDLPGTKKFEIDSKTLKKLHPKIRKFLVKYGI